MSYGMKTFLIFFTEAFLVFLIIIYGYESFEKNRINYKEFYNDELVKKEMREVMSFDKYNGNTVTGAEVYYAIKYYRGSDIGVCIVRGSTETFYNKKIVNGEYVLGALQDEADFEIEAIMSLIDFNKSYKTKLVKHKNDFVVLIKFREI